MSLRPPSLVLAVFLLAACGGAPTIVSFTAAPAELPQGGGKVVLSWDVNGSGDVRIDPDVGEVKGHTRVVELTQTKTFVLTAGRGKSQATASVQVVVPKVIDVQGKVVDASDGTPIAGRLVLVSGKPSVVTGADGSFTVQGVAAPYQATVFDFGESSADVYLGVTRADPTFSVRHLRTVYSATCDGVVSGGAGLPIPTDYRTRVFAFALQSRGSFSAASNGAYSGTFRWSGHSASTGYLHALQSRVSGVDAPIEYTGYAKVAASFVDGATVTRNLSLSSISTATISGSIRLPEGYVFGDSGGYFYFPDGGRVPLPLSGTVEAFTFNSPLLPGAYVDLVVGGAPSEFAQSYATVHQLPTNATGVQVVVAPAPQITSPTVDANGVRRDAVFSWTAASDPSVYEVRLHHRDDPSAPRLRIFTSKSQLTLPDLAAHGFFVRAGGRYTLQVFQRGPYPDIDASAAPWTQAPLGNVSFERSASLSFTFAP